MSGADCFGSFCVKTSIRNEVQEKGSRTAPQAIATMHDLIWIFMWSVFTYRVPQGG